MMRIEKHELAAMIDHTQLKADATKAQVVEVARQAREYGFASVFVHPCHLKTLVEELKGSGVKACTVAGFPLGTNASEAKAFEARMAVQAGAQEVDMVMNIGALKDRDLEYVERDIRGVVEAAGGVTVKVILETCYLTDEEKVLACRLAQKAGAHYVKTSTGLAGGGATVEDIRLMRKTVGPEMGVKAAGGIRTYEEAVAMVEAGANRIGTSAGVGILNGLRGTGAY